MIYSLFFSFIFFASAVTENNINQVTALAREYRLDPRNEAHAEHARRLAIIQRAESLLLDYGSCNHLIEAVQKFTESVIGQHNVVRAAENGMAGTTEDSVFLLFNDGKLAYVVKAFKNMAARRGKFLTEISGLDLLMQLQLTESTPVIPLAVASCICHGEHYVLLLETAAEGKRLDQCIIEVGHASNWDLRLYFLNCAIQAYEQAGKALAELHSKKSADLHFIPCQHVERQLLAENAVCNHPGIIAAVNEKASIGAFKDYLERSRQAALQEKFYLSYCHGDAHSENLFYNQQNNTINFIDLTRLHASSDIESKPILDGAMDLLHMEEDFIKMALPILLEEEIRLIKRSLFMSYADASGGLPNPGHQAFYRNYFKLKRLYSSVNDDNKKAIFEASLEYFVEQIRLAQVQAE